MKRKKFEFWQHVCVCRKGCLQHVDRKAIAGARRDMRQITKNGIREFVLNSLMSNTIMSKGHGHGLPPITRNVKDIRFNGNIICRKHGIRYIKFLKAHSITTSIISNMDRSKLFMVTPTHAKQWLTQRQP